MWQYEENPDNYYQPTSIITPICQRVPKQKFPWYVGGNTIEQLIFPSTNNTQQFGIIDTTGFATFQNLGINAGGAQPIFINGLQQEGTEYATELSRRVEIQNGAVETIYVPIAKQRVSDDNSTQFIDLYFEVFSNAYSLDITEEDITNIPADQALRSAAVNINNIFLGKTPDNYPNSYGFYPTTGITPEIEPSSSLRGKEFTFTLVINNTTESLIDVIFTKTSPFTPVFPLKYTPTYVSYNIAPYTIPAGGTLIADFRVKQVADDIPPEYKMIAPALTYP